MSPILARAFPPRRYLVYIRVTADGVPAGEEKDGPFRYRWVAELIAWVYTDDTRTATVVDLGA